jgi:hypothetical protein
MKNEFFFFEMTGNLVKLKIVTIKVFGCLCLPAIFKSLLGLSYKTSFFLRPQGG